MKGSIVKYKGEDYILDQDPYASNDEWGDNTFVANARKVSDINKLNNGKTNLDDIDLYEIEWLIIDAESEDHSLKCDWLTPRRIINLRSCDYV